MDFLTSDQYKLGVLPRDLDLLLDIIKEQAKISLDIVIYEMGDPTINQLIKEIGFKGIPVRIIFNGYYYSGQKEHVAQLQLLRSEVPYSNVEMVYSNDFYKITHQKTLIFNANTSQRSVLICSCNLNTKPKYPTFDHNSSTFTKKYAKGNLLNYNSLDGFVHVRSHPVVDAVYDMFETDWNNLPNVKPKHNPHLVWSAGCTVDSLNKSSVPLSEVHPYGTFYNTLKQMISSAKRSIHIWAEQFVYPIDQIMSWKPKNVVLTVYLPEYPVSSSTKRAFQLAFKDEKTSISFAKNCNYGHLKALIIDEERMMIGSTNLSVESIYGNKQLNVLVQGTPVLQALNQWKTYEYIPIDRNEYLGDPKPHDFKYYPRLPKGKFPGGTPVKSFQI